MKAPAAAPLDEPGMAADFVVGLRKGSFTDLEAANRLVNATLLRNRVKVDRVVEGKASRAALDALFGWETGKEAFAMDGQTDPQIRDTYGVRVVIVTDHSDYDYSRIVREAQLVVDTRNATRGIDSPNLVRC